MKLKPKFRRVDSHKYSKLGVRRKNKQKYRKPTGRDNKIRLNYAGRLKKVKVGFRSEKKTRGLVKQMEPIMIHNVKDLSKITEGTIGVLGKIGNKKKKEIVEYLQKNNIKLLNFSPEKFLKKLEIKDRELKEKQKARDTKRKSKEKQVKEKKGDKKSEDKKSEDKKSEDKKEKTSEDKTKESKKTNKDKKSTEKIKENKEEEKNESK